MNDDRDDHEAAIVRACRRLAERLGLGAGVAPVVIGRHSNLALWLDPTPWVARVATGTAGPRSEAGRARRELAIARALAEAAAPVAAPAPGGWAGPHLEDGWRVTLWQRLDLAEGPPDPTAAGRALARCHARLKTLPDVLAESPISPWSPLHEAERLLAHPQVRERAGSDLGWVADRLARLAGPVLNHPAPRQWLHGDAHLNNCRPLRSGEPVWLDWEDACLAPLEWELAGLVGAARVLGPLADSERAWAEAALAGWRDAHSSGPSIDETLLDRCVELRALFIVAWSWWLGSRTPQQADRLAARLGWLREPPPEWGLGWRA